jgi:uncharacterized lipoprotein YajG
MLRWRRNVAMQKTSLLALAAPLAGLLVLAACEKKPPEVVGGPADPQAEALKNAPKVEAPPMIQASRTYRCKDNSLVYADFYTNNTVQLRTAKDGTPTTLTAADAKGPFTADGYSLSANAPQIQLTVPGKAGQSCKA